MYSRTIPQFNKMDASELEEGEISGSDSETGEKQKLRQVPSGYNVVQSNSMASAWTARRENPASFAYRASKPSCLSSGESDSEEEFGTSPCKMFKQRRVQGPGGSTTDNHPFNNPLAAKVKKGFDANMWTPMVEESKAKKRNNIWGNVIQDQDLSATISNVAVERGDIRVERSVESYDVHSKYLVALHDENSNDSNSRATDGSDRDHEEDMKDETVTDNLFDENPTGDAICDKESFAGSLMKPKKKSIKSRLGARLDDDSSSHSSFGNSRPNTPCDPLDGTPGMCNLESFGNDSKNKSKTSVKDRLGVRDHMDIDTTEGKRQNRKRHHKVGRRSVKDRLAPQIDDQQTMLTCIKISVDDKVEDVALGIVKTLMEPDHMLETFVRVVTVLGAQKALEILHMTEDVEGNGGMMTMRGDRRRTAGGVYLQLLKDDQSLSPQQMATIFSEQREKQKKEKKERARRHRDRVNAERERRLKEQGMSCQSSELPLLPEKKDVVHPEVDSRELMAQGDNPFDDELHNDCEEIMLEAV